MSNKNQFTVDLGHLELNDSQIGKINSAIQKAAMNEIAALGFDNSNYCVLFPRPPICGFIIREIDETILRSIEDGTISEKKLTVLNG